MLAVQEIKIMTLKKYVAMAIFFCAAAWLWVTGAQRADAERKVVASQYSLGAQQMTVYDKCIDAMEHKGLRAGGSKQQFCGCLVQRGLRDLRPDESDTILGWIRNGTPDPATVTDRQDRVLVAAIGCSEDTRSTWSSAAALQSWCAEKDARRSLPQCKLGAK
jgi:hypothetical protein